MACLNSPYWKKRARKAMSKKSKTAQSASQKKKIPVVRLNVFSDVAIVKKK